MARLARLVWRWSSARSHFAGENDELVEVAPRLNHDRDFARFLGGDEDRQATRALRMAQTPGRPIGNADWLAGIEQRTGRSIARENGNQSRE